MALFDPNRYVISRWYRFFNRRRAKYPTNQKAITEYRQYILNLYKENLSDLNDKAKSRENNKRIKTIKKKIKEVNDLLPENSPVVAEITPETTPEAVENVSPPVVLPGPDATKEDWLNFISEHGMELENVPKDFMDWSMAIRAFRNNPESIKLIPQEIHDDKTFVTNCLTTVLSDPKLFNSIITTVITMGQYINKRGNVKQGMVEKKSIEEFLSNFKNRDLVIEYFTDKDVLRAVGESRKYNALKLLRDMQADQSKIINDFHGNLENSPTEATILYNETIAKFRKESQSIIDNTKEQNKILIQQSELCAKEQEQNKEKAEKAAEEALIAAKEKAKAEKETARRGQAVEALKPQAVARIKEQGIAMERELQNNF